MYIKKPAKEMLLSNLDEESVGKTGDSIKRRKVHNECNAESRVKIKVKLDFNQYVKLHLCKILPFQEVTVAYRDSLIFGPENKCRQLLNSIKEQFQRNSYKLIKFKVLGDLDQIQYQLFTKYDFKIFKPKILQLVAKQLDKVDYFQYDCLSFLRKVHEGAFLIRIDKEKAKQCVQFIQNILREKEEGRKYIKIEKELSELSQSDCQEQVLGRNIYDVMKQQAQNKDRVLHLNKEEQNQEMFMLNETISQSSQNKFSQTNSSLFVQNLTQQQLQIKTTKKPRIQISQSFC